MSLKSQIKHIISFIIHGEQKPMVANISYLQPSNQLAGKKIIITGGGRGIGYSMAKKFIAEGAQVLIAGRKEQTLRDSALRLGCKYLVLDIQELDTFNSFIDDAFNILSGVDILVNNAGISLHEKEYVNVKEGQFDSQFRTNLKGPYFLTQLFIQKCKNSTSDGIKKVLFISSETSTTVDVLPYGLTKVALNSLVQGLAYRFVNEGFRINAVAPGVTISDMIGVVDDGNLFCDYNITKRFYQPEEIAEVACFLLSDISNCINGQTIVCNEGKTINARWK